MKRYIFPIFPALLLIVLQISTGWGGESAASEKSCRIHAGKSDCANDPPWCKSREGSCTPEMRGRCGKRRGDWYGARQPVTTVEEARKLLTAYFAGQDYTVSRVLEKKWGYTADILDRDRKIIDRVMIDKRSGRIRSLD